MTRPFAPVRVLRLLALLTLLSAGLATTCPPTILRPFGPLPVWDAARFPWPMHAQNVRRTGQSPYNGPLTYTPGSPLNWTYTAVGGAVINLQAVVTNGGVYFGTWGVLRRDANQTPDKWDKSDGRWYGLRLAAQASESQQELFDPELPAPTPVGYLREGRGKLPRDVFWTGGDNDYLVSFYNGTIEGTPCVDPDDGTQYVGRGDGRLFAIDPNTGQVKWIFETFNPEDPDDPDGGGEIIGGPVMGVDKIIYFGTVGVPWPAQAQSNPIYETHAVYAVNTSGELVWRYPASVARLSNWIMTPPALSNTGRTLYVGTFAGDTTTPGKLLALDLTQSPQAGDGQRLRWVLELRHPTRALQPNLYVRAIAVGIDGRIYCAGNELHIFGTSPAVFAVDDLGNRSAFAWPDGVVEPQDYPSLTGQFCAGIALRESNGQVETVFVSTTHLRITNGTGGALFALDPQTGAVRHSFDPATLDDPGIGGMTAPTLGANGTVYVGIRGRHPTLGAPSVNGHMYALSYSPDDGFALLWDAEIDGQLDWVPPAIGANGGLYFGSSAAFAPAAQIEWFEFGEIPPDRSPKFHAISE